MVDQRSTRPPPPTVERVDLARLDLRKRFTPREEHRETEDDRLARALSGLEGRLLQRIADLKDDQSDRDSDRPSRIQVQVAPAVVDKKHWAVTAGTVAAGVLAGAGALVGAVAGLWSQTHHADSLSPDVQSCIEFDKKAAAQFSAINDYEFGFRRQVRGAFDAQGLHFPDAQGEPKKLPDGTPLAPLEFLTPPKPDAHHVGTTPVLQPAAPIALPPKF